MKNPGVPSGIVVLARICSFRPAQDRNAFARAVGIEGVEVKALPMKGVGRRMVGAPDTVLRLSVQRGFDDLGVTLMRGGLTKLPDSAFKQRLIANGIN